MNATTAQKSHAAKVCFRAEICCLGPIMGAPPEGAGGVVTIAGAEDPALGKAFVAVLVPVRFNGAHYEQVDKDARFPDKWESDRHGWFTIFAPSALWEVPAAGVLVVMLYHESRDPENYSYEDYRRTAQKDRKGIDKAIDEAIDDLLGRKTTEDVRKVMTELHRLPAPEPGDRRELVLAVGSCQFPSAMLENEVAGASYGRLAARLDENKPPRPHCVLLVGDQIYADGTAGLFDPTSQYDRFVRPYEILFRMISVRNVLRRLPAFMMLDDHEINNNWEPHVDEWRPDPRMAEGRRSFLKFQRRAGPAEEPQVRDSLNPVWYRFEFNGFPLFMADTRTERTARTARTIPMARIMSKGQMSALLCWLKGRPADVPKIVASPSILLPRHSRAAQRNATASVLRSDGWDGYPRSLHRVLAFIAHEKIRNVVFLSGDEHLSCVARVVVEAADGEPILFHSVHCSPLFAPFPFANSVRADLVAQDAFEFRSASDADDTGVKGADCELPKVDGVYNCRVYTEFAASGDGFALLRFHRDAGTWTMECDFDRAGDPPPKGVTRIVRTLT